MPWTYEVPTGKLWRDGKFIGVGYSGIGAGLNNSSEEKDQDIGPIPCGLWFISEFFNDLSAGGKGPVVAHLTPAFGTDTFGRSSFMIHGDNKAMNHTASHGCMIFGRFYRDLIMASSDQELEVVDKYVVAA
jgi:hypothetical protein